MRIALIVDPYLPVPPVTYGGIERVVDFLVRELVARGHRVSLFAHPASRGPAALRSYGKPPHTGWARLVEIGQLSARVSARHRDFDVVHSFGSLAALLPVLPRRALPKIQSYQRPIPWRVVRAAARLAERSLVFTGCSRQIHERAAGRPGYGEWRTILNGVDLTRYVAVSVAVPDAPLVFLGKLTASKGVHNAIAVARAAGRRLVIAGTRGWFGPNAEYFERQVAPHVDGERVVYVGAVGDQDKNELLGRAAALLMLIEWEEPFGIVMAEAMACGTPVIGFRRGSVPEIVRDGETGFVCDDVGGAVSCVGRLAEIDRAAVRRDCERRFGHDVIASAYEDLYGEMIDRSGKA